MSIESRTRFWRNGPVRRVTLPDNYGTHAPGRKETPRQDPDNHIKVLGLNTIVHESTNRNGYLRIHHINEAEIVVRRGFWRTRIGNWLGNKIGRSEQIVWVEDNVSDNSTPGLRRQR